MEYGNCKNLPIWAEILLNETRTPEDSQEPREHLQPEADYGATAA